MLSREQSQEELAKFRIENALKRSEQRLSKLPTPISGLGNQLLTHIEVQKDRSGQVSYFYSRRTSIEEKDFLATFVQLEHLKPKERIKLFGALFPKFPEAVESAWQLRKSMPYQIGYSRKAFRVPDAEVTLNARGTWLFQLLTFTLPYEEDIAWFAAWTPYLGYGADTLGYLFAGAINNENKEGQAVFDILIASANGEHEIGAMGRHVTRALLTCSDLKAWEYMEKMLLAAQRQEGLRQVILETIDEAHPEAFRRMLKLIYKEDLSRFAAVIRAIDVWFNFQFETGSGKQIKQVLGQVIEFLESPKTRQKALKTEGGQGTYLALWVTAFENAYEAIEKAKPLLEDANVEKRFAAIYLLGQVGLVNSLELLAAALEDVDLRVAFKAWQVLCTSQDSDEHVPDLFERFEALIARIPKEEKLPSLIWDWTEMTISKAQTTGNLYRFLGDRDPTRLLPYVQFMDSYARSNLVRLLTEKAKEGNVDALIRETLFSFVADTTAHVRQSAIKGLEVFKINPTEAKNLEPLLTRKAGDLRRGVIGLLLKQEGEYPFESVERLLSASKSLERQAGLEMLRELKNAKQSPKAVEELAKSYQDRPKISDTEKALLTEILQAESEVHTLDNGLGLFDPAKRSQPITTQNRLKGNSKQAGRKFVSKKTAKLIEALDDFIYQYRETPIQLATWQGDREELLGNLRFFPYPRDHKPLVKQLEQIPLWDTWLTWWQDRPKQLRDDDSLEIVRIEAAWQATALTNQLSNKDILNKFSQKLYGSCNFEKLKQQLLTQRLIKWFFVIELNSEALDFLLDGFETSLTLTPQDAFLQWQKLVEQSQKDWYRGAPRGDLRSNTVQFCYFNLLCQSRKLCPQIWTPEHYKRLWGLLRTYDEGFKGAERYRADFFELLQAYKTKAANEHDVYDHLIGSRKAGSYYSFRELRKLTKHKEAEEFKEYPDLKGYVELCRERILEVELARADLPTAASPVARALRSIYGIERPLAILNSLGKQPFIRGYTSDNLSKTASFSHLLRVSFPKEDETAEDFIKRAKDLKISDQRLLDLAVFAPQWANYVAKTIGWKDLEDAIYWLHAHTKDTSWTVDREVREIWEAEVRERTPLTGRNLLDGAVDVTWFQKVYKALGKKNWAQLDKSVKYASGGGGHKRAQLFAGALLGELEEKELLERIWEKRNQDTLRALGLLPLSRSKTKRRKQLLSRYKAIQEFLRGSKKFGSQRQASEKLATSIAMENLARTAGYPDPQRLTWAMEAEAISDLAKGPVSVKEDDVTVSLFIDNDGGAQFEITKATKKGSQKLKNVPAKLRKHPEIANLRERKSDIAKQTSRMRTSLEEAMCKGDEFTTSELQELFKHPVLRPMLTELVFITEGNALGYPQEEGKVLLSADDSETTLGETKVRIAHAYDLLDSGDWHTYQQKCFTEERKQPFKQVFRELYVLTKAEKEAKKHSKRYEGHQVNPRQALALLGQRGWVNVPEEGVRCTFFAENISAWLYFHEGFYTPAEVDGLTVDQVHFSERGKWQPLELESVPPRLFSEVMRDLDLVVSIAHRGGVDPETSASTVEMRTALLRETLNQLKIDNVKLERSHALIKGELGSYSVHLGSAMVHRQPGGALFIIPVPSQHRGRLFLPFADDDPKTAEVISKVILLAKDKEIKDPTVLEQLL